MCGPTFCLYRHRLGFCTNLSTPQSTHVWQTLIFWKFNCWKLSVSASGYMTPIPRLISVLAQYPWLVCEMATLYGRLVEHQTIIRVMWHLSLGSSAFMGAAYTMKFMTVMSQIKRHDCRGYYILDSNGQVTLDGPPGSICDVYLSPSKMDFPTVYK